MSAQTDAAWAMLGLFSVGLLALAIGLYYWRKQQMQHKLAAPPQHHPNFEAMASSELNRAGNMKHLMQVPEPGKPTSSGYDAPVGTSHVEVAEFQPQSLTAAAPQALKIDNTMTANADASLFENPYFSQRDFEFPKISHQASSEVYADDSIEYDDSYIDGVLKISGITSTESEDNGDHRYPRPAITSSTDYSKSNISDDDYEDVEPYVEGKLDLQGITTGESSDDPKDNNLLAVKRKISVGELKFDQDMREARRLSADLRPGTLDLQFIPGIHQEASNTLDDPNKDNDLVVVTQRDLNNSDSPKSSGSDPTPSFETIDAPSIIVNESPMGAPSFMNDMKFTGFGDTDATPPVTTSTPNPNNPFSGLSNPLFVDTDTMATQSLSLSASSGASRSDTSPDNDFTFVGISKDEVGDFVGGT